MTHKALIRQLQISCLGLDRIDPLCLLVDDVIAALAQPEQEPVAWRIKVETKLRDGSVDVGYQLRNEKMSAYDEPLYTHPPQRTWVGLTNEELTDLFYNTNLGQQSAVAQAIALLKEKNT
jgi:hypothetical protein